MGKIAEAYVDITARMDTLPGALKKAQGQVNSFVAGAGGMLGKVALGGLAAGGVGSLAGAGAALLSVTRRAADLGETVSKVRTTFGDSAGSVLAQADDLAGGFGVVKQEALDAAAAFGLMGRAAGLSAAEQAKMSTELVQLGLDLASFHNISNEEAFLKIRSGLAGEAEPLRPLGIMLSEDAVKAEAVAIGLAKVKRELTESEKVIARTSLIKKQAGPAVGDLARTADSAANRMRKLEGELVNGAIAFGATLIPALQEGLKLAYDIGDALRNGSGKKGTPVGQAAEEAVRTARLQAQHGPVKYFMASVMDRIGLGGDGIVAGWNQQVIDQDRKQAVQDKALAGKFGEAKHQAELLSDPAEAARAKASVKAQRRADAEAKSKAADDAQKARGAGARNVLDMTPQQYMAGLAPGAFSAAGGATLRGGVQMWNRIEGDRMVKKAEDSRGAEDSGKDARVTRWGDELERVKQKVEEIKAAEKGASEDEKKAGEAKVDALERYQDVLKEGERRAEAVVDAEKDLKQTRDDQAWDRAWERTHKKFQSQSFTDAADFSRYANAKALERDPVDKGDVKQLRDANAKLDKANETLNKMLDKLGVARAS